MTPRELFTQIKNRDYRVTLNGDVCRIIDVTPIYFTAVNSVWVDYLKAELFNPPKTIKRKRWETAAVYAKRMRKKGCK